MAQRTDACPHLKRHIFVIVATFGGYSLRHLASRLVNVIRQGGREADQKPSFSDFFLKSIFKLL